MTICALNAAIRTRMNEPTIDPIALHPAAKPNRESLHVAGQRHRPHREPAKTIAGSSPGHGSQGDRLEHVRRWSFTQPIPFSGQVRRLIMEANANFLLARDEGLRALAWAEAAP